MYFTLCSRGLTSRNAPYVCSGTRNTGKEEGEWDEQDKDTWDHGTGKKVRGGEAERERGMMTQMMTALMPHMCEYINPGAQNLRSSGGQGGKREYDFGRRRYLNCVGPLT